MRFRLPQNRRPGSFFFRKLAIVALIVIFGAPAGLKQMAQLNPMDPSGKVAAHREATNPRLPNGRLAHILYGDNSGGGHLHGMNKPCKSEFPAAWSEKDIADTVKNIAANDNAGWLQQNNGNYVADTMDHGVKIRVVLSRDRSEIITAYPLNTPRNPCPASNDNDP